CARTGTYFDYW
nr:immunoglobulin heavy chain junction region [Mus musculus]